MFYNKTSELLFSILIEQSLELLLKFRIAKKDHNKSECLLALLQMKM